MAGIVMGLQVITPKCSTKVKAVYKINKHKFQKIKASMFKFRRLSFFPFSQAYGASYH
jgi:hypothetical protein